MTEQETNQNKGFISESVAQYNKYEDSGLIAKIFFLFYLGFAIVVILLFLQPDAGQNTIIHSNRYNCDIIYERALTREEIPEYDPIVWEKDHVKSQDFTVSYVDTGSWSYQRYGLSTLHLVFILLMPAIMVGIGQFMFGMAPDREILRIVDDSDRPFFTKRAGIRECRGYIEIDIYDARKIPKFIPFLSGSWWLGKKRYTVNAYPFLVTRKDSQNLIIINGLVLGNLVRVTQSKSNKIMPDLVEKLNYHTEMSETKEGLIKNSYKYIGETESNMMDIVRNMAEAVRLANNNKDNLEHIIEKTFYKLLRVKGVDIHE